MREEYSRTVFYPPAEDIFNAFHFTPLSEVKVLLLGQDPITNVNQAHGLSFSVLPEQKEIPPSLQNIYKELQDDLGCYIPNNGYLKNGQIRECFCSTPSSPCARTRRIPIREEAGSSSLMRSFRQ